MRFFPVPGGAQALRPNLLLWLVLGLAPAAGAASADRAQAPTVPIQPASASVASSSAASTQVELAQSLPTTMEEIAAMDVLRELCPSLLPTQQHTAFQKGLAIALKQMMPGLPNPLLALDSLKSDAGYQALYRQASADARAATTTDNRQICQDILSYNKKH